MAHLSLPNSELHVALTAAGTPALEAVCARPGTAVLFPTEDALDADSIEVPPETLVVIDGTWSNARKVVINCPLLSKLPRVAFRPDAPSRYRIRAEPDDAFVSTIEATAIVLEKLERAPGRFRPILTAFDAMVDRIRTSNTSSAAIIQACKDVGLPNFVQLANRPDLVPQVWGKLWGAL
jgi:DTW domain-containing protein YfiP